MESLFSSFQEIDASKWKDQIIKDLKGKTFDDLAITDENGIRVFPFYNSENKGNSQQVFNDPNWDIKTRIIVKNKKDANKKALVDLENGAHALQFIFEKDEELINWDELLENIQIQFIHTEFQFKNKPTNCFNNLNQYLKKQDLNFHELHSSINYDPIRELVVEQKEFQKEAFISFYKESKIDHLYVDGTIYQNAGAHSTYQMACIFAHLNEYLHLLNENKACSQIKKIYIKTASGTLFFEEIAKIRALRICLKNIIDVYEIEPEIYIDAETSRLYLSHVDIYNNILRNSISGMAAVIGGCDSLLIHDFQEGNKGKPGFAKRIGRNQQLIFKEESYFNKVADIAQGSFYLETLTQEIAEKGWALFQDIEKQNGLLDAWKKGIISTQIETQSNKLIQEYKDGKRILIGVNKHKNKEETSINHIWESNNKGLKFINLSHELLN